MTVSHRVPPRPGRTLERGVFTVSPPRKGGRGTHSTGRLKGETVSGHTPTPWRRNRNREFSRGVGVGNDPSQAGRFTSFSPPDRWFQGARRIIRPKPASENRCNNWTLSGMGT